MDRLFRQQETDKFKEVLHHFLELFLNNKLAAAL